MSEKTATSILLEYCSKSKVAQPQYEIVSQAGTPNNPIFTISVKAFGCVANGSGHSKSLAKHAASQALIGKSKVYYTLYKLRHSHPAHL